MGGVSPFQGGEARTFEISTFFPAGAPDESRNEKGSRRTGDNGTMRCLKAEGKKKSGGEREGALALFPLLGGNEPKRG